MNTSLANVEKKVDTVNKEVNDKMTKMNEKLQQEMKTSNKIKRYIHSMND